MLLLDENIPAEQRQWLLRWGIRFRRIGVDLAALGTDDENLLPVLHQLPRPTFFTLDRDFFRVTWRHRNYCLVWLDVADDLAAAFIRRFLGHPAFDTQAKRMGIVARVHKEGIVFWQLPNRLPQTVSWSD